MLNKKTITHKLIILTLMKKFLHFFVAAALTAMPLGAFADNDNPGFGWTSYSAGSSVSGAPTKGSFYNGYMPCDYANTVYDQGIDITYPGNKGFVKSDRSLCAYRGNYYRSRGFASFANNTCPIDGIRVYAFFVNADYSFSSVEELTKRFNLDENGNMKTPIKLDVTFCENTNGYPSSTIHEETVEVYGTKSQGLVGDPDHGEAQIPIYCFDIKLSKTLRLESGWLCIAASDTGEKQETAFAMVSDATPKGGSIIYMSEEGSLNEIVASGGAFNFCFTGDRSESIANKGLKFMRVLGPDSDEKGRYAKVQVELWNYGKTPINDAKLTLLDGETELATEEIEATIPNGKNYQYTFKKRIDCSGEGTHKFTVRNDTPGDEHFTSQTVSFTTNNTKGSLCTSSSKYNAAYKYITSVKCGSINNESDWSKYSDFRNKSTDLAPGQTIQLEVKGRAQKGDYIKVWIDWNNDGSFDGEGELIGYASSKILDISIPSNTIVQPGAHVMRIILSKDVDQSPCSEYEYGETEDYTINVVRPEGSPVSSIDTNEIVFNSDINDDPAKQIKIKNEGSGQLDLNYQVVYSLPFLPNTTPIYRAPKMDRPEKLSVAHVKQDKNRVSPATNEDPLVLTYAGDYKAATGAAYQSVRFSHYYPATALAAIKGMKISSIDVYLIDAAKEKSEVCIWKGSAAQMYTSEQVLYSQEFTPVANGWNHIQFKEPFVITAEDDLYIGVRLTGCEELQWEIGIDNNPANLGYGDLMSYGNSPTWWSLADLGADANVLIRANVTGARTPAVDWLKLDKTSDTIAPGGEATLTVTANPWLVDKTVYDGMIRITSNDPLAKGAKIPVYLDNYDGTVNGMKFINVDADKNNLRITADRRITVDTDKHVSYMAIFTVDGRQIAMNFDTNAIDASALQYGVYAVKAVLADGTTVSGTVAVK